MIYDCKVWFKLNGSDKEEVVKQSGWREQEAAGEAIKRIEQKYPNATDVNCPTK